MALRLDDLQSKNKVTMVPKTMEFSDLAYDQHQALPRLEEAPKRDLNQLRPWQGSEAQDFETRTYAANEAVSRAREKTRKNEMLAMELRAGFVSDQKIHKLKEQEEQRDKFFNFHEQQLQEEQSKIRTSSVFVKFFRDLVRQ